MYYYFPDYSVRPCGWTSFANRHYWLRPVWILCQNIKTRRYVFLFKNRRLHHCVHLAACTAQSRYKQSRKSVPDWSLLIQGGKNPQTFLAVSFVSNAVYLTQKGCGTLTVTKHHWHSREAKKMKKASFVYHTLDLPSFKRTVSILPRNV